MNHGSVNFLEPWHPVEIERRQAILGEARTEISSGHKLHEKDIAPIAFSQEADDVLFGLDDGRVAMVHLTESPSRTAALAEG